MSENVGGVEGQAGKVPAPAPAGAGLHEGLVVAGAVPLVKEEVKAPGKDPVPPQPQAARPEAVQPVPSAAVPATAQPQVVPQPVAEARPAVAAQGAVGSGSFDAEAALPEGDLDIYEAPRLPRLRGGGGGTKGRRLVKPAEKDAHVTVTPEQKLLILDTWSRSGLPGSDFANIVGLSKQTLHVWKKRFEEEGPAGLMDRPRGVG